MQQGVLGPLVQRTPSCSAANPQGDQVTKLELVFGDDELRAFVHLSASTAICELPASFSPKTGVLPEAGRYSLSGHEQIRFEGESPVQVTIVGLAGLPISEQAFIVIRLGSGFGEIDEPSDVTAPIPEGDEGRGGAKPVPELPKESGPTPGPMPSPPAKEPPVDSDVPKADLTPAQRAKLQALQSLGGRSEGLREQVEDLNEIFAAWKVCPYLEGLTVMPWCRSLQSCFHG